MKGMKLKVLGSELNALDWRQAMMKELSPHIPTGVTLGITDDNFGSMMLDYLVDGTIEVINLHNSEKGILGMWFLMDANLWYDDEVMK